MKNMEEYFTKYRSNIVGIDNSFVTPYGKKDLVYADWIASGRLYSSIEEKIQNAQRVHIMDAGHVMSVEKQDDVNNAILDFLNEIEPDKA